MRELERVRPNLAGQSSRYSQAWPLARLASVSLAVPWVPLSSHRFCLAHHTAWSPQDSGTDRGTEARPIFRQESLRQADLSERSQCLIPQPKVSPDLGVPSAITESRSRGECSVPKALLGFDPFVNVLWPRILCRPPGSVHLSTVPSPGRPSLTSSSLPDLRRGSSTHPLCPGA